MEMLEEFPWERAAARVCLLADNKEVADRAIAWCAIMGAEIQNVQAQNVYRAFYHGAVFGSWLYPSRAAVAFCIAMNLNIET